MPDRPVSHPHTSLRVGGWLPHRPTAIRDYVARLIAEDKARPRKLLSPVKALADLIARDKELRFLAERMIDQVPAKYAWDPAGAPEIRSVRQMLRLINRVIRKPPPYNDSELVGFPINAILDWPMGTAAGWSFFLHDEVNAAFREILGWWCDYLDSSASLEAFDKRKPHNWVSKSALRQVEIDQFQTTRKRPPWGFTSWNDFFTRKFKRGKRRVAGRGDPRVIVSACESTPFAIQNDVRKKDKFWLKAQPYSLREMLGPFADEFVGGTVYQAFLDAFAYHRWHSPVAGVIVSAENIPGTYYAEAASQGFDPGGPNLSQGYIAHVATRAVIIIKATNPKIGLVAVVPVGMSEVSSCILENRHGNKLEGGYKIRKGGQLGYFQFGGSTHCLVFQKGVIDSFDVQAIPGPEAKRVNLRSKIALARG